MRSDTASHSVGEPKEQFLKMGARQKFFVRSTTTKLPCARYVSGRNRVEFGAIRALKT
jgi:tRNA threonylcarbamoyladenosine modification (KEOPS) complex Cgi121 subunit